MANKRKAAGLLPSPTPKRLKSSAEARNTTSKHIEKPPDMPVSHLATNSNDRPEQISGENNRHTPLSPSGAPQARNTETEPQTAPLEDKEEPPLLRSRNKSHYRRIKQQDAKPVLLTDPEIVADWQGEGFVFPKIPNTDKKAWKRAAARELAATTESAASSSPQAADDWQTQALEHLEKRFEDNAKRFDDDAKKDPNSAEKKKLRLTPESPADMDKSEDWHVLSYREPGAAAANGLLNAAIIPPLGYSGDIRKLVSKELLPAAEMSVAVSNALAIDMWKKKYDEWGEKLKSKRPKK